MPAAAQLKVEFVPTNPPSDRVTLDIDGTTISLPARDVAQLIIDKIARSAEPLPISALTREPPHIGELWAGEGGWYAGTVRGDARQPDYHLLVAEPQSEETNWKAAVEWAQSQSLHGFRDYTLPKRKEQSVLFGNVPELFVREAYWSSESHADVAEFAWCQTFYYGFQDSCHKYDELRARAVRRVPIQ